MPQMKKTLGQPAEKMSQTTRRDYLVRMKVRYQRRREARAGVELAGDANDKEWHDGSGEPPTELAAPLGFCF